MNFLLISATVLLVGITIWIWRLSKPQITDLSLKTSIIPNQNVTTSPMFKPNSFGIWYNKAIAIIRKKTLFAILAGLIFVGVYLFYQKVKNNTWMSSIISIEIAIVILIVFLTSGILTVKRRRMKEDKVVSKSYVQDALKYKEKEQALRQDKLGPEQAERESYVEDSLKSKEKELFKQAASESSEEMDEFGSEPAEREMKEIEKSIPIDKPKRIVFELIPKTEEADGMYDIRSETLIEYSGVATLPHKVYVGDSHSISINLKPTSLISYGEKAFRIEDSKNGKIIILHIQQDSLEQFLEVQLLAAGLVVDGKKTQRQKLSLPTLTYSWNCYFPNSGDHVISFIIRVVSQSNAIELGTIHHSIKVAHLDHLTQRQVQMGGIITGGMAAAISLQQLGVLQKIIFYLFP